MKEQLKELFNKYQIEYNNQQLELLNQFFEIVVEENKKFNLTAITEKRDFAIKHLLDCALPAPLLPNGAKIIDIGAGAGFPSIVLKIMRPDLEVMMLDSLNKRVNFLNETVGKLGLNNIEAVHARAEDYALKNREKFDVAIARAVAGLNTLCEYCLPFVKVGGVFVALKGANYEQELAEAHNAIMLLGGELANVNKVFVEEIESQRANMVINKIKPTPNKYPRGKNLPRLKPLS